MVTVSPGRADRMGSVMVCMGNTEIGRMRFVIVCMVKMIPSLSILDWTLHENIVTGKNWFDSWYCCLLTLLTNDFQCVLQNRVTVLCLFLLWLYQQYLVDFIACIHQGWFTVSGATIWLAWTGGQIQRNWAWKQSCLFPFGPLNKALFIQLTWLNKKNKNKKKTGSIHHQEDTKKSGFLTFAWGDHCENYRSDTYFSGHLTS